MKFGVREICDVTFKAAAQDQKIGSRSFNKYQPVFTIDTAQTSNMEQASTTVYAQGGRGYNRLIAWEGEKTLTFTVTDALMSPMGLAVLTSAGLINAGEKNASVHVHCTIDAAVTAGVATISYDELAEEIGIRNDSPILVCGDTHTPVYGTLLDGSGYGYNWFDNVAITAPAKSETGDVYSVAKDSSLSFAIRTTGDTVDTSVNGTVKFDFYVVMKSGATEITIEPGDFGGYFYVEADTLYRREDDGQDMAATLTFPRVKVQSAFTFTMAASGDPSTFDFTMDAFPGYTQFDQTKKVCVTMAIVGDDASAINSSASHSQHIESGSTQVITLSGGSVTGNTLTFILNATVAENNVSISVDDGDDETEAIVTTKNVIAGDNTITIDVSTLTLTAPTTLVVTAGGKTLNVSISE